MKIETTKQTKIEIDLELPCFFKDGTIYYGMLNDNNSVCIYRDEISKTTTNAVAQFFDESKVVSAGEFTTAFDSKISELQYLKSEFFKK